MANTKITNHIVDATVISAQTAVTAAGGDYVLIQDVSDSNNLKKALASDFGNTTEQVQDIIGGMVSSNTESGITVAYEDGDGTLDFTVGTLNQNTTGTAATVTGAAQTAITSVGTLTSLAITGDFNVESGTFFVDVSNNNVGLGTTSPSTGQAGNTAGLHVKNSAPFIRLQDDTGTGADWELYAFDHKLYFYDNEDSAATMVLDGGGNVGIGTASPGVLLDLLTSSGDTVINIKSTTGGDPELRFDSAASSRNGVIRFLDQGSAAGQIIYAHNGDTMSFHRANEGTASLLLKDGNVAIGTTEARAKLTAYVGNPTGKGVLANSGLHIANGTGTNAIGQITFGPAAQTNASSYIGELVVDTNGNTHGDLLFGTRNVTTDTAPTERMRIQSDGTIQLGDSTTGNASNVVIMPAGKLFLDAGGNTYIQESSGDVVDFYSGGALRIRLNSNGLEVPDQITHTGDTDTNIAFDTNTINFTTGNVAGLQMINGVNYMAGTPTLPSGSAERSYIYHNNASNTSLHIGNQYNVAGATINFHVNNAKRMYIDGRGFVGIGDTGVTDSVSGAAGPVLRLEGNNPEIVFSDDAGTANQLSIYYLNYTMQFHSPQKNGGAGSVASLNAQTGNFACAGALSKGSGSFKIDHPLPAKNSTHHLVHSFIEGPQADLIYRGTATLSSGTVTVNLDTVAGMTEGTYVLLNTNTSCFTSNETDWDAVKGSVSGNILTINCQNSSSTATVSWLVIGERQDQHMKDTDWTDVDGKVIVEPLK